MNRTHRFAAHMALALPMVAGTIACSPNNDTPDAGVTDGGTTDGGQTDGGGGQTDGGGGQTDGGMTMPTVETCDNAPTASPGADVCEVTAGDDRMLIVGTVLQPGKVIEGGQVLVDAQGEITCVGCGCADQAAGATTVICEDASISPGLINAHDHMGWMGDIPRSPTEASGLRYEHRHDWRKGDSGDGEPKITAQGNSNIDEKAWGELRFALSGATSTFASGVSHGLIRNLDRNSGLLGLNVAEGQYETFPLGDSSGAKHDTGCNYGGIDQPGDIALDQAYVPHVSEGIEQSAYNEFLCLNGAQGGSDVLRENTAIVHGVGLTATEIATMAAENIKLIWSPRSNVALYGDTAPVGAYQRLGVTIALGTDWMPSGSMNMLREIRCADELNDNYYGGTFSDEDIWRMATVNGARALMVDNRIGVLSEGRVADIAIFRRNGKAPYQAVVEAEVDDVALVLRGGDVLNGNANVVAGLEANCDTVDVCGTEKRVCLSRELDGKTYAQLSSSGRNSVYPAFFCGVPDDEPTCTPYRDTNESVLGSSVYNMDPGAGDQDGDGVADADDNCPTQFNPVRPLDGALFGEGNQADVDSDGLGDVCDPCPIDANTTECTTIDPDDVDGDGLPNLQDNCPTSANADQADQDMDGKGDVCDACPDVANPGAQKCPGIPVSIQAIQDTTHMEHPAVDTRVQVTCVVTAVNNSVVWCQDPAGGAFSGIAALPTTMTLDDGNGMRAPVRGDEVRIDGDYVEFYDLTELTDAHLTYVSTQPVPAAAVMNPADIANGGMSAEAYESVLVRVENVEVTVQNADAEENRDYDEFVITGNLRVNDTIYTDLDNTFEVGAPFSSITGVLNYSFSNFKLEPRDADDLTFGPATVKEFGMHNGFARVGEAGTVDIVLTRAADADVTVMLSSSEPGFATVPASVVVGAGSQTASVAITAVAAGATTLTATHDGAMATLDLTVVAANAVPSVASVMPTTVDTSVGRTTDLTVTLDMPAPAAGTTVTATVDPAPIASLSATSIMVPAGAMTATVTLTADAVGSTTVTFAAGTGSEDVAVTVAEAPAGALVINEVDYDQAGADTAEFIELYNGGATVDLAGYTVVLYSQGALYSTTMLTGSLASGAYLIVGAAGTAPDGVAFVAIDGGSIQNGENDAVALFDASGALVDALSYEGEVSVDIGGTTTSLVSGERTLVEDTNSGTESICRAADGVDSGDDATDWVLCPSPTPGAPNNAP